VPDVVAHFLQKTDDGEAACVSELTSPFPSGRGEQSEKGRWGGAAVVLAVPSWFMFQNASRSRRV
ncbi:MAG: hypothetical protein KDA44_18405, partial [Planctomycetales bacterium]|nr:hypothetical protein [Planctomycetales bacterium]